MAEEPLYHTHRSGLNPLKYHEITVDLKILENKEGCTLFFYVLYLWTLFFQHHVT